MFSKEFKILLLITISLIAACIETDIYLPAFTDMMNYFLVSEVEIQKLLTWNFIGICVSCPFYGPISDAIGRKKPLITALGLFLVGSLVTCFAENYTFVLLGRVLQGIGSGGCFTLGTAIIFDAFQEKKAIDAFNKLNIIIPFVMALAPMVGGYLNYNLGFRSNFFAIGIVVMLSFLICLLFFEETLEKEKRITFRIKEVLQNYAKVTLSIPFWQTTLIVSLLFAGYITFLSTISVYYIIELGMNKNELPLHQGFILTIWLIASLLSKRLIEKLGVPLLKGVGSLLILLGGLGFFTLMWTFPNNAYLLTFCMALYSFGVNWVITFYFPEGMEIFPEIKGITSSLITSLRLLIVAATVGFASHVYDGTSFPLIVILLAIIGVCLATIVLYERKRAFNLNTKYAQEIHTL